MTLKPKEKIGLGIFIVGALLLMMFVSGNPAPIEDNLVHPMVSLEKYNLLKAIASRDADSIGQSIDDIYDIDITVPGQYKFSRNTSSGIGWIIIDSETMEVTETSSNKMWFDSIVFELVRKAHDAGCRDETCAEDIIAENNPFEVE